MRVSRSELDRIAAGKAVTEAVSFPSGSRLVYGVAIEQRADVGVRFANEELMILLPEAAVRRWLDEHEVAIRGAHILDNGEQLSLLVEKDYECLTPSAEDQSDLFPNPTGASCG
jgi:Family of unknown function (DUF7009)